MLDLELGFKSGKTMHISMEKCTGDGCADGNAAESFAEDLIVTTWVLIT